MRNVTRFLAASAALCAIPLISAAQIGAMPPGPAATMPGPTNTQGQPAVPTTSPPATTSAPATAETGAAANTSAAPTQSLATGMTVKDNTGASIGTISALDASASGAMATIKMRSGSFRAPESSLGVQGGSATINLTSAQIQAQLHPK